MVDGTRAQPPSGWLDEVCPEPLRRRIQAGQAAGEVLEPLVEHWVAGIAGLVAEVEAALGRATDGDDEFEALAGLVGLNALTELVDRVGSYCRQATETYPGA